MTPSRSASALPILNVVAEALWYCWRARHELWKVLVLPALFLIAITMLDPWVRGTRSFIVALLYSSLPLVVFSFAAVSCHRLILLGPGSVSPFGVTGMEKREWRFFARAALLSLGTQILYAIVSTIGAKTITTLSAGAFLTPAIASTVSWIIILLLVSPFSLTLPACAVDESVTFQQAWRLSRGHVWRLAFLISGLPWLMQLGEWAVAMLFDSYTDQRFVSLLLFVLILPAEIALLSVCYRRLRETHRG